MQRTALAIALLIASASVSATPWTYHGTLNDGGKPANGTYDLRLTLLNEAGTTSVTQPITLYNVPVNDGNFSAEVEFGIDLSLAPALKLKTEVGQNNSGFSSLSEPIRFDPKAALAGTCWDTTGNVVAPGEFLGSTNSVPLVLKSNNMEVLRMSGGLAFGASNIQAGSPANTIDLGFAGQTIAGGGDLSIGCGPTSDLSCKNSTSASFATVGGGRGNSATGYDSTLSGGYSSRSFGPYSTVGGGIYNVASGNSATVSGGATANASGNFATVIGGQANTASGLLSTVSGGIGNCAGGDLSWAGGFSAIVRPGNEAGDGNCAANSGDADGDNGTFVWADDQSAFFTSTGPRQFLVRAQGGMAINTNTPAAGAALTVNGNATINPIGSLSFGSQTRQMLNLWGPNDFGIGVQTGTLYSRSNTSFAWFQGGVHNDGFNNAGGGTVRMTLDSLGQLRTTTGTIATVSDARLKKNVSDYTGALSQIAALRPVYFEYKDSSQPFEAPGQHLGFIAQEVEKVFPQWVSKDEQGYLSLSLRGFEAVAVRAMQELEAENATLRDSDSAQNAELAAMRAENAALRASGAAQSARLDALEKALQR